MFCCKIRNCVITLLTIVFMVLGLVVTIPGIVMMIKIYLLSDNIKPMLEQVELASIFDNLLIDFIILGALILVIIMLVLVWACCKLKTSVVVSTIIAVLVALGEVILLVLFFNLRSQLDNTIKSDFLSQLQTGYTKDDLDKSDEVSSSYNYMFMKMECCGVNGVNGTTNDFDNTPWRSGSGSSLKLPKGCCIGATEGTYCYYKNTACTDNATSGTYWPDGCYDKVVSSFGPTLVAMEDSYLVALVLQIVTAVVLVVIAIWHCRRSTKK